jgi:hypothetical protein
MAQEKIYDSLASLHAALELKAQQVYGSTAPCGANPGGWYLHSHGTGASDMLIVNSNYTSVTQDYLNNNKTVEKTAYSPASSGQVNSETNQSITITKANTSFKSDARTTGFSQAFGVQASYGVDSTYLQMSYTAVLSDSKTRTTGGGSSSSVSKTTDSKYDASEGPYELKYWTNNYTLVGNKELIVTYDIGSLDFHNSCNWKSQHNHANNKSRIGHMTLIPHGTVGAIPISGSPTTGDSLGMSTNSFKVKTYVSYKASWSDPWPVSERVPPLPTKGH